MTNVQATQLQERPVQILLVDDDSIFGVGLQTILGNQNYTDLQIINQVSSAESALDSLTTYLPDLIVLELDLRLSDPTQLSGLQLAQILQNQYPNLPVFLLTAQTNPEQLIAAYNFGVKGYCLKGTPVDTLVRALRQVARGQNSWEIPEQLATIIPQKKANNWLNRQLKAGLYQIDANLKQVNNSLNTSQLPLLDWLFWTGRKRELKLARWLVNQFTPVEYVVVQNLPPVQNNSSSLPPESTSQLNLIAQQQRSLNNSDVLVKTLSKIQAGVENLSKKPLEIDVLKGKYKKELLYLVTTQVERTVKELKFIDSTEQDLTATIQSIIKEIWQCCSFEFITRYYGYVFENRVTLLDILIKEVDYIDRDILSQIPFSLEIFEYFISPDANQEPEKVKTRFEILGENMVIQIANSVMLIILNNFVDIILDQPDIYNQNIESSRDIAQFRNRLSWKYRVDKYLEDPKNIFEDQYLVYYFENRGIKTTYIKANRKKELKQLQGFRWLVTIAIEARDTISPGVKTLIDSLGKSVVYLLTEVIGKAIGLIGKGFIQGIGNTLQETRYRSRNPREK